MEEKFSFASLADKISRGAIYIAVFLLPLFFLPWTADALDFNKQALLVFLGVVALIAWLAKSLAESKLEINPSAVGIPILAMLVISGISTVFSMSRYGSFWGWPLSTSSGLLSLVGFVLAYFLITNIFRKPEEIFGLMLTAAASAFFVGLLGIIQMFGNFFLPFDFAKVASFNTIGTVNAMAIFLAGLLPVVVALFFVSGQEWLKTILGIFGLISFAVLILVNFWVVWSVMIAGMVILFVFLMSHPRITDNRYMIFPMVVITIAFALILFRMPLPGLPKMPVEVSPSQGASFNIAQDVLKDRPMLGSGPGTFVFDYSLFKPDGINQTSFWAVRFGNASSWMLENLATVGILGTLSFLMAIGFFMWLGVKRFISAKIGKEKNAPASSAAIASGKQKEWQSILEIGLFSGWFGITVGFFLYPANFSILWLFWILIAAFISLSSMKIKSWKFEPSSPVTMGISFAFVLALLLGIGLFYIYGQNYVAETKYVQAIRALNRGEIDNSINSMAEAINLNRNQDTFWRDFSQIYLAKINETLGKKDIPRDQLAQNLQALFANTVNSVKQATDLEPNNVANWSVRGFVLRNLVGVMGGADDWAVKSYEEALKLEPKNPLFYTEIGRVYAAKAGLLAQSKDKENEMNDNYNLALDNFNKSLQLKQDYATAHYQIALIYVAQGKIKDAIAKMENAKQSAPLDVGISFQLAALYYNDQQLDNAQAEFERTISMNPNYSNARYFLGLIYDKKGNKQSAIEQFAKIQELNPDNQDVKKILDNLRAGKSALEGVGATEQPPIQENGPGVKK